MHRVDTATAAAGLPAPEAQGQPGYFTKGDPTSGVSATVPGQDFFNMIQEELVGVVLAAGLTLDETKANLGQLLQALQAGFGMAKSLGSSGYVTLPGGVIVQWGNLVIPSGGAGTWAYPVTFPSAVWLVFLTPYSSASAQYASTVTPGLSSCDVYGSTPSIALACMAIGH